MIVAKSYGSHEERARARLSPTFTSSDDTLYTIQIFLHSALDMDTRSLDESDVVVDRPLRPASSGMSWRFNDLTRRSVWHMGWIQRLSDDDDDTASDTERLYITMIDQVCQSLYCSSYRCAN